MVLDLERPRNSLERSILSVEFCYVWLAIRWKRVNGAIVNAVQRLNGERF